MSNEKNQSMYRKHRNSIKGALLFFLLLAGLGMFYHETSAAQVKNSDIWGMVDAKESNVNAKVAGRVLNLYVKEGDAVTKGQVIARIDSDTQAPASRQATAAVAAQTAQLRQAETARKLAAKDEQRYRTLLASGAVSEQTYDTYKTALEQAEAACDAASEQLKATQNQREQVNVALEETEVRAPYDGIITKKYVEEGSLVSTSVPIYSVQDTRDNWVDFKVKETQLNNFAVGDEIHMVGRNSDIKISGKIESIRRKADFATQKATSERGETDTMAFNVKVRTDDASLWPGMRFKIEQK